MSTAHAGLWQRQLTTHTNITTTSVWFSAESCYSYLSDYSTTIMQYVHVFSTLFYTILIWLWCCLSILVDIMCLSAIRASWQILHLLLSSKNPICLTFNPTLFFSICMMLIWQLLMLSWWPSNLPCSPPSAWCSPDSHWCCPDDLPTYLVLLHQAVTNVLMTFHTALFSSIKQSIMLSWWPSMLPCSPPSNSR